MHPQIGLDHHVDGAMPQPRRHRKCIEGMRVIGGHRHPHPGGKHRQPLETRRPHRRIGHENVGAHFRHHFGLPQRGAGKAHGAQPQLLRGDTR